MATILDFPFGYNTTIYKYADFLNLAFVFYTDEAGTNPVDYSASTFEGEVLDVVAGKKEFDFTFNDPDIGGVVWPQLTAAQTATITGRKLHYWVKVITAGVEEGYFSGELIVSDNFIPGTV
jgi:hypothetical protein